MNKEYHCLTYNLGSGFVPGKPAHLHVYTPTDRAQPGYCSCLNILVIGFILVITFFFLFLRDTNCVSIHLKKKKKRTMIVHGCLTTRGSGSDTPIQ